MDLAIFGKTKMKLLMMIFLNLSVNRLKDQYLQNWSAKCMLNKKLTYYSSYKTKFTVEYYVHALDIVKFQNVLLLLDVLFTIFLLKQVDTMA
jgi:hypothetical protein